MTPRRLLVALVAALVALVALRRRRAVAEHVTILYEDGSSVTLERGSRDGDRLLELARPAVTG